MGPGQLYGVMTSLNYPHSDTFAEQLDQMKGVIDGIPAAAGENIVKKFYQEWQKELLYWLKEITKFDWKHFEKELENHASETGGIFGKFEESTRTGEAGTRENEVGG